MRPGREELETKRWYRAFRVAGFLYIFALCVGAVVVFALVLPSPKSIPVFEGIECKNGKLYTLEEINQLRAPLPPVGATYLLTKKEIEEYRNSLKSICAQGTATGFIPDEQNYQRVEFPVPRLLRRFTPPVISALSVLVSGLMLLFFVRWAIVYIVYGKKK